MVVPHVPLINDLLALWNHPVRYSSTIPLDLWGVLGDHFVHNSNMWSLLSSDTFMFLKCAQNTSKQIVVTVCFPWLHFLEHPPNIPSIERQMYSHTIGSESHISSKLNHDEINSIVLLWLVCVCSVTLRWKMLFTNSIQMVLTPYNSNYKISFLCYWICCPPSFTYKHRENRWVTATTIHGLLAAHSSFNIRVWLPMFSVSKSP